MLMAHCRSEPLITWAIVHPRSSQTTDIVERRQLLSMMLGGEPLDYLDDLTVAGSKCKAHMSMVRAAAAAVSVERAFYEGDRTFDLMLSALNADTWTKSLRLYFHKESEASALPPLMVPGSPSLA